jgi:hypothetical protein
MSTSPNTQKGNDFAKQPASAARNNRVRGKPGLILLKGILWLALIVGVLIAIGMNYEIVWSVLVETVVPALETVFEVAEEALDSFYLLVGVSAALAPMATAYTGFVLLLAVIYLVSRKGIKVYQKIQSKQQEIGQTYAGAWNEWYGTVKATVQERSLNWWDSLDNYNKVFALIFMILIGIPVMLLISLILGNLVATLI